MNARKGWIGVDLDGTLAVYDGYKGLNGIGSPIAPMVDRVKAWLAEGREVRIMTARVSQSIYRPRETDVFRTVCAIEDWCELHIGQRLKVTCIKDFEMTELWDDRAVQVIPNTGISLQRKLEILEDDNAELRMQRGRLRDENDRLVQQLVCGVTA